MRPELVDIAQGERAAAAALAAAVFARPRGTRRPGATDAPDTASFAGRDRDALAADVADAVVHGARLEGRLVAVASTRPCRVAAGGRLVPAAWLSHVAVVADARGRGIAAALVAHAFARAHARGAELVALHAARAELYERAGARVRGRLGHVETPAPAPRPIDPACVVRLETPDDRAAIEALHAREAARHDGLVVAHADAGRRESGARERTTRWVVATDGRIRARALVSLARTRGETLLLVRACLVEDAAARDALVEQLRARHPDARTWRVRGAPEDLGGAFDARSARHVPGEFWLAHGDVAEGWVRPSRPTRFES